MSAFEIGKQLCDLCNAGQGDQCLEKLYADDIVSVEAADGGAEMPREMNGIDAIRGKNEWWYANNEVHNFKADGPFPHGDDRFGVIFDLDVTPKAGPMAGNRMQMRELGLYTVKNGKIAREEFYYHMG